MIRSPLTDQVVVITGGAGFIGSNLCEYFLKKDYKNALFYYDQSLQIAKVSLKKVDTLNYNNLVFNVNNNVINVKLIHILLS